MAQYLGQVGTPQPSIADSLNLFAQQTQQRKLQQQALAQKLIESGAYAPTAQQPPMGLLGRIGQGFLGPQIGGSNMNVGGQNYQFQDQATKLSNLKEQLGAIQGLNGQQQGQGTPSLGNTTGGLPSSLPGVQVNPKIDPNSMTATPDITMTTPLQQVEYLTKVQELKDKQGASSTDDIYSKSPEEVKNSLMKSNPAVVRIGDRMIKGGMTFKDLPGFGKNANLKSQVAKYVASQGIDEQALALRKKTKFDYSPGGTIGKQLISAGTIVQHLGRLKDAIEELKNSDWIPGNKMSQTWARTFGSKKLPAMRKYELMGQLLSEEYSKYMKGGAPAESGIERILNTMSEADPVNVQEQVLQEGADAMGGRLGRMVSGWYDVFNLPNDQKMPSTILDPQTKESLRKMGMSDVIDDVESPENKNPQQEMKTDKSQSQGKYSVGQVIPMNGKKYKVIGGDPNDPDVEEMK